MNTFTNVLFVRKQLYRLLNSEFMKEHTKHKTKLQSICALSAVTLAPTWRKWSYTSNVIPKKKFWMKRLPGSGFGALQQVTGGSSFCPSHSGTPTAHHIHNKQTCKFIPYLKPVKECPLPCLCWCLSWQPSTWPSGPSWCTPGQCHWLPLLWNS